MALIDFLSKRSRNTDGSEMPFIDHLEALRWHIIRAAIAYLICVCVAFYYMRSFIYPVIIMGPSRSSFITYRFLCKVSHSLNWKNLCMQDFQISFQNLEMAGQFNAHISNSFFIGFLIAFPYIFFELWQFIKPALKPSELRMGNRLIFWVVILFGMGVLFSYYVISPYSIQFFATYQLDPSIKNEFTIDNYISMLINLTLGSGLIFMLPIFSYFFSKIGILTPQAMRSYRRHAIVVILIIAAIITPPDVMSQMLVAMPVLVLYEIGIMISSSIYKKQKKEESETSLLYD